MASLPREGPTISVVMISAAAGNFPARHPFARAMASFQETVPVISERPPEVAQLVTPGAE